MPSTDKARINSKASMAQSVSQTTVCSNGLKFSILHRIIIKNVRNNHMEI